MYINFSSYVFSSKVANHAENADSKSGNANVTSDVCFFVRVYINIYNNASFMFVNKHVRNKKDMS